MSKKIIETIIISVITLIFTVGGAWLSKLVTEENTIQSIASNFTDVKDNMKIEEAIEIISSNYEMLNSENEELRKKLEAFQGEEVIAQNVINSIEKAKTFYQEGDFVSALKTLQTVNDGSNPEVEHLYSMYQKEYELHVIEEVNAFIQNKNYSQAQNELNFALSIIPNSGALSIKQSELKESIPQPIQKLKLGYSRYYEFRDGKVSDSVGNSYSSGVGVIYAEGKEGYGTATYYTGKNYKYFSAQISVSDESEIRDDSNLCGWIEIYTKNGDEYTKIWESVMLDRLTIPQKINDLKIDNAEWIEIRYYNAGEYWNLSGGNHSLRILITDGMVYN